MDSQLARAEAHKPLTAEGMRGAVHELLRNGLTDHDISQVLRLDVSQVRRLVADGSTAQGKPILHITVPEKGARPSDFRERFVMEIRKAILAAARAGAIDLADAEEMWRALPALEPRQ